MLVVGLESTCQFLDTLPKWQGGDFVRGGYGCRWLRLSWLAWRLDNRWGTGVWSTREPGLSMPTAGDGHLASSRSSRRSPGGG